MEEPMKFTDVHVHWLLGGLSQTHVAHSLSALKAKGLEKVVVFATALFGMSAEQAKRFLGPWEKDLTKECEEVSQVAELIVSHQDGELVVPFIDVRCLNLGEIERLNEYRKTYPFKGIKAIYAPREIPEFGERATNGFAEMLGISVSDYVRLHEDLFEFAGHNRLPITYHINLNTDFDHMVDLLRSFPTVQVNVAHFGYSMKRMSSLFERFESCYSDFSALLPHIRSNRRRYSEFMSEFSERILLGSDCLGSNLKEALFYAEEVKSLLGESEVAEQVLFQNAERFLSGVKQ
jgi:hypothetical protein